MAIYELKTFGDIIEKVREDLGVQSSDTKAIIKIKRAINSYYINEVVPFKRWLWLQKRTKIIHKAFYSVNTCAVNTSSTAVTLNIAPDVSYGSFAGYLFATDATDEIYEIASHTAGSADLVLTSAYQGDLSATVNYKIWRDTIDLPVDCRETIDLWHNFHKEPMQARGFQEIREIIQNGPRASGYPAVYNTLDYTDPTPLTGETETDRYRTCRIHPSITDRPVTIDVEYVVEVAPLENNSDEPLMPLEDRMVLVYGAEIDGFSNIARNESRADKAFQLAQNKLARMSGKIEDGFDTPIIQPKSGYLKAMRRGRFGSSAKYSDFCTGSSGSNTSLSKYLQDVTIEGGTITDNITVTPGKTIDGVDISVLKSDFDALNLSINGDLDAHILDTTTHGTTSDIVGVDDVQILTGKTIDADVNTITNLAHGTEVDDPSFGVHGVTGSVVGTDDAQTLENKTIIMPGATGDVFLKTNATTKAIEESTLMASSVEYLANSEALTSETLTDNSTGVVIAKTAATWDVIVVLYSIKRGTAFEAGQFVVITDGTNASKSHSYTNIGDVGVTLTAAINGADIEVSYATTSTGTNATMKYKLHKWQA